MSRHGPLRIIKAYHSRFTNTPFWGHATKRDSGRTGVNEQELRKRLELLRSEHRDLDVAIDALIEAGEQNGFVDQLQIARLKKRKLQLKDRIAMIEDTLLPDIIA